MSRGEGGGILHHIERILGIIKYKGEMGNIHDDMRD